MNRVTKHRFDLYSGRGVVTGIVKIVTEAEDLKKVKQNYIMVTSIEYSDFMFAVLSIQSGAIVTDTGGVLFHMAIVARALAIPAVGGTSTATSSLQDGRRVTVDGTRGTVSEVQ